MLKPVPSIYLKRGGYSRYGFALGYVERHRTRHRLCSMWLEHGVYQIRVDDTDRRVVESWEAFPTLVFARKAWAAVVRGNQDRS